ncbi:DUF4367 domain-containing protein [Brevibacillus humidisoli]|uniref:DUF4367 domain-containing protein n=1 Tax=Brevibacillus humidisoli TaxID=2895522 RepID=UPI001E389B4C|nr:DUF4367 domain-containing protein [Brevibacillus humidisoli]UFJ39297.1 DUF4367 domain-containing protein [Brevibacillus humidisoli]
MDKDQDLKELFHNAQLPEVDLTGSVMRKLNANQNKKERFTVKNKVGLLVVAGVLLTVSSGFAMFKYGSLQNQQGEVVYEVKPSKELEQPQYQEEDLNRLAMSSQLADELLQDGSAAIFYIVPNNPNHQLETEVKSEVFTDASALRSKLKDESAAIMDSLKEDYKFTWARLTFDPVTEVNPLTPKEQAATAEKLRKQAEESNKEYAMMPVELSDDHWRILSTYKKGESEIQVFVSRSDEPTTIYAHDEWNWKSEKIDVNGVEMLYTEYEGGGKGIVWVHEIAGTEQHLQYNIQVGNDISKEGLIEIAKSYLK